jgi:hypothetical protein
VIPPASSVTFKFNVVIDADGAWSRTRWLLSPAQPTYTGVTFVDIQLALGVANEDDEDGKEAKGATVAQVELTNPVGRATLFASDDRRSLRRSATAAINVMHVHTAVPSHSRHKWFTARRRRASNGPPLCGRRYEPWNGGRQMVRISVSGFPKQRLLRHT